MRYFSNSILPLVKNIFVFCLLPFAYCLLFSSCQKEELPVPGHNSGNVITSTVNMEPNYKWQIYFDLKTNSIVNKNLKTVWDIAFETTGDGYRVILNSSKAMYAANTGNTNFLSVIDTTGFSNSKKFDVPSGYLDSTAIGDWRTTNKIYIIDRGYSETGAHQGFRKIQFQNVDANKYTIRFAELNGNGDTSIEISKDSIYNFTFLSFTTKSTVIIEPPKADWDLVFTQYLEALPTPYLVTGVLLNRYGTSAVMDSLKTFFQITYSDALNYSLSSKLTAIGYKWKKYDYGTSSYIVYPQMNYIIKDSEGIYYKIHFIDFYDTSGNKGNPKWEQQQL